MPRPRLSSARLRARRAQRRAVPASEDLDSTWIEVGGAELRLWRDGGDVVWSAALPDPALALGRLEFGALELASLHGGDEDDPDVDPDVESEEPILERS